MVIKPNIEYLDIYLDPKAQNKMQTAVVDALQGKSGKYISNEGHKTKLQSDDFRHELIYLFGNAIPSRFMEIRGDEVFGEKNRQNPGLIKSLNDIDLFSTFYITRPLTIIQPEQWESGERGNLFANYSTFQQGYIEFRKQLNEALGER